jgi:hypothetical protein
MRDLSWKSPVIHRVHNFQVIDSYCAIHHFSIVLSAAPPPGIPPIPRLRLKHFRHGDKSKLVYDVVFVIVVLEIFPLPARRAAMATED